MYKTSLNMSQCEYRKHHRDESRNSGEVDCAVAIGQLREPEDINIMILLLEVLSRKGPSRLLLCSYIMRVQ